MTKIKSFTFDRYIFRSITKTKSMKRRSGGYSYIFEGNAFWKDTKKFAGSFRVSTKNLTEFKSKIKTGMVHFNIRRRI